MQTIRCEAILFDLDGVLADSSAAIRQSWHRWAESHAIDPARVMAEAHGRRTRDTIAVVAPDLDPAVEGEKVTALELEQNYLTRPFNGAHRLLAELNGLRPYAVVTSGQRVLATARLQQCGLPVPGVFVTADDVRDGKPSPEGYLQAARLLDVDPAGCVVVEDAPAGIQAAKTAGMMAIGVASWHSVDELSAADAVLAALSDLTIEDAGPPIVLSLRPANG